MPVTSTILLLLTLSAGILSLAFFAWAFRKGAFDEVHLQANDVFDERDLRIQRPWESAAQQAERIEQYGSPVSPCRGEWGGAK